MVRREKDMGHVLKWPEVQAHGGVGQGTGPTGDRTVSSGMIWADVLRSLCGVRCVHRVRVSRCLVCRVKVDGRMWARVQRVTQDHETTEAVMHAVVEELERAQQRR